MDPRFLTEREVLRIHDDQIRRYGGSAEVRDLSLLRSALAVAEGGIGDQYFHEFLSKWRRRICFTSLENHPFVDGNKRTGAVAAIAFLALNGFRYRGTVDELEALGMSVARGEMDKQEIEELRKHSDEP